MSKKAIHIVDRTQPVLEVAHHPTMYCGLVLGPQEPCQTYDAGKGTCPLCLKRYKESRNE